MLNITIAIKNVLRALDGKKCLFSCSAGSDSRIITALLSQLRDEEGCNFDDILFCCWGRPEKDAFLALMQRCGWKNIYILDDTRENPYNIGNSIPSVDGWHPYTSQMQF